MTTRHEHLRTLVPGKEGEAHLIVDVQAEGCAGMEGSSGLRGGVDVGNLIGQHPAIGMVDDCIDAPIPDGLRHNGLGVLHAAQACAAEHVRR